jgi:hypothetical protein
MLLEPPPGMGPRFSLLRSRSTDEPARGFWPRSTYLRLTASRKKSKLSISQAEALKVASAPRHPYDLSRAIPVSPGLDRTLTSRSSDGHARLRVPLSLFLERSRCLRLGGSSEIEPRPVPESVSSSIDFIPRREGRGPEKSPGFSSSLTAMWDVEEASPVGNAVRLFSCAYRTLYGNLSGAPKKLDGTL